MEVPVSIVVYIPLYFNRVDGALLKQKLAMARSQPQCPEPIFDSNKGSNQDQQYITTYLASLPEATPAR